jgi:hypothetical protein
MINNRVSGTASSTNTSACSANEQNKTFPTNSNNEKASYMQLDGPYDHYSSTLPSPSRTGFAQPPPRTQHHNRLQFQTRHQYQHQTSNGANPQGHARQQALQAENAVADLLPFCTGGPPLQQEQIIALSDVAGSLKEVMLLALGAAAGDTSCVDKLEGSVGRATAAQIVEFFVDEWEVE